MLYVTNAFSLNMLSETPVSVDVMEIRAETARNMLDACEFRSAVGHADTAALFSAILGQHVPAERTTVQLTRNDWLLVGQYSGPRLPEGATQLPEGATIRWFQVTLD
jgi:hypothetical protein